MTIVNRFSSMLTACAVLALASSATIAQQTHVTRIDKRVAPFHEFKPDDSIMSRNELRFCMKLNASNKLRIDELGVKVAQNAKERQELDAKRVSDQTPSTEADEQLETEWKKRNKALRKEEEKLEDSRHEYFADCARRRFLEDDEAAINAGK